MNRVAARIVHFFLLLMCVEIAPLATEIEDCLNNLRSAEQYKLVKQFIVKEATFDDLVSIEWILKQHSDVNDVSKKLASLSILLILYLRKSDGIQLLLITTGPLMAVLPSIFNFVLDPTGEERLTSKRIGDLQNLIDKKIVYTMKSSLAQS